MSAGWSEHLLAWGLTYLVHSAILIAGVWLLVRIARPRARTENAAWRLALVGGLLTATLQLGLGVDPIGGRLAAPVTAKRAAPDAAAHSAAVQPASRIVLALELSRLVRHLDAADESSAPAVASARSGAGAPLSWAALALTVWLVGAIALGALLFRSWRRLRHRLADRAPVETGPMTGALEALDGRARPAVRLSCCDGVPVPITWGLLRHEICVPRRALALSADYQEAMVAHELAHVRRFDAAWTVAGAAVETLLFFQPLNRLVTHRMRASSELACDEWAADRTRRPLALAGCLTEVASWIAPPLGAPAAAMASGRSGLRQRVEQLVRPPRSKTRAALWLLPVLAAALVALIVAAPGARPALAAEPDTPAPASKPAAKANKAGAAKQPAKKKPKPAKSPEHAKLDAELRKEMRALATLVKDQVRAEIDLDELRRDLADARKEIAEALGDDGVRKELANARKELREAAKELSAKGAEGGELAKLALKMAERAIPTDDELDKLVGGALKIAERAIPTDDELEALVLHASKLADEIVDSDLITDELDDLSLEEKREMLEELRKELRKARAKPPKPAKKPKPAKTPKPATP